MAPSKHFTRSVKRAPNQPAHGSPNTTTPPTNPTTNPTVSDPMTAPTFAPNPTDNALSAATKPFVPTNNPNPSHDPHQHPNFDAVTESWEQRFQEDDPEISQLLGENHHGNPKEDEQSMETIGKDTDEESDEGKGCGGNLKEDEDELDEVAKSPSSIDPLIMMEIRDNKNEVKRELFRYQKTVDANLNAVKSDIGNINEKMGKMDKHISSELNKLVASGKAINQLLVDNQLAASSIKPKAAPMPFTAADQIFRDPAQMEKAASRIINPFTIQPETESIPINRTVTNHTHPDSTQASPKSTQLQPEFTTPTQTDQRPTSPNTTATQASAHQATSMIFQGQKYVTSPIIYKAGDMVFWRHHSGLLIQVQVNKVYICNPIEYDIMLLHDHTIYKAEHTDLFILDDPTKIQTTASPASEKATTVPSVPLTPVQMLALTAFPDRQPEDIARWDAMDKTKFQLRTFSRLLSYVTIKDSSIPALHSFYLHIATSIESAHSEGATIFPSLELMKPSDTLTTLILPPSNYQYYSRAYGFFISLGNMLKFMLDDPATTKNSPIAQRALASVADVTANGFDLLTAVLKNSIPHLGAIGINPQSMIDQLILLNGEDVYQFLQKAQNVNKTIQLSKLRPSPNALFTQVMNQILRSSEHKPYLIQKQTKFVEHLRIHTINAEYHGDDVNTIVAYLLTIDAPIHASISNTPAITPSTQQIVDPTILDTTSSASATKGFFADNDDEEDDPNNKSTYQGLRHAHLSTQHDHEQDTDTDPEDYFQLRSHALRPTSNQDKSYKTRGILKSNQRDYPKRDVCEACTRTGHKGERCELRGEEFRPTWLNRRIAQYNTVHGNKPKDPSATERQPTPTQPQFKVRSIRSEIDEMSQELMKELDEGVPSDKLSHRAIQVRFQQSGSTSKPPADQSIFADNDKNQDDSHPITEDSEDPLCLADYDVYRSQVNF